MADTRPGATVRSIQALRALAAMLVVLFHLHLSPKGYLGVDLFFVISGFIMGTVGSTDRPVNFMVRRAIRIVPLYWAVTAAICLLSLAPGLMRTFQFTLADLARSLLFIPYRSDNGEIWPLVVPGWTLNFEMFFYLLFALALALGRPRLTTCMMIVLLVALGASLPGRDAIYVTYTSPLMLEFAAGLALASFGDRVPRWAAIAMLLAGALAYAHVLLMPQPLAEGFERVLRAGVPALLVVAGCLFTERAGMWPALRPVEYVGDISYSLYLTHGLILPLAARLLPAGWIEVTAGIALSLAGAAAAYHLFERPSANWLNAMWRKRSVPPDR